MAWATKKNGSNRPTYLFDSFEGFPEATKEDNDVVVKINAKLEAEYKNYIVASYDDAVQIAEKLRMDGDLYGSTLTALEELYDQISPGGYVVIDDYDFDGCRQAIYEFFVSRKIAPEIKFGGNTNGGTSNSRCDRSTYF